MPLCPRIVSVPGNLLIAGEYAVLEPGGLGLACAVAPRLTITAEPADVLRIRGRTGVSIFEYPPHGNNPLFDAVVNAAAACATLPGVSITIDSSALYDADRGKLGYGSSAAVAAGLLFMLLAWSRAPYMPDISRAGDIGAIRQDLRVQELARLAVKAHRDAQQGRGSGYDVLASFFGGAGLFHGGEECRWSPCNAAWLESLTIVLGESSFDTKPAVSAFQTWRSANSIDAARYVRCTNRIVAKLSGLEDVSAAVPWLRRAGRISRWLAAQIGKNPGGLDAVIQAAEQAGGAAKTLGAGDEIGVVYTPGNQYIYSVNQRLPLVVEAKGLQWSQ